MELSFSLVFAGWYCTILGDWRWSVALRACGETGLIASWDMALRKLYAQDVTTKS